MTTAVQSGSDGLQRTLAISMGWRIETWEQPSGTAASQDAHLVMPDPAGRRLRVAVLDGVTPTENCRTAAGVDGAMYAAAIARLALQDPERPLERCVISANEHLHDARITRSRDQRQTCVTAVDIHPDGAVDVVRAGDCEAWALTDRGWVALGTGTALAPQATAALDEWQAAHPTASRGLRHDAEERYLGRAEAWTSTALGRFGQPVLQRYRARDVSELVLASDGARLSSGVLDDLPAWLRGLRAWERQRPDLSTASGKLHDDVTVIRLRRSAIAVEPVPAGEPARPRSLRRLDAPDEERRAA
jgi:hypothetical protein